MTLNATPLYNGVLVMKVAEQEVAKPGVIIPDAAKETPQEGETIAIGLGTIKKGQPVRIDARAGDSMLFGKYTGNEIDVDDQGYLIVREEEILETFGRDAKISE